MTRIELRARGAKKSSAKFRQLSLNFRGKFSNKFARDAYSYAKKHAPVARDRYGGGTRDAIEFIKQPKSAKVVLHQPDKRPRKRPYHLWMHNVGRYNIASHIKTGNPKFMNSAFRKSIRNKRKYTNEITNKYLR